jgi:hypothetical protein
VSISRSQFGHRATEIDLPPRRPTVVSDEQDPAKRVTVVPIREAHCVKLMAPGRGWSPNPIELMACVGGVQQGDTSTRAAAPPTEHPPVAAAYGREGRDVQLVVGPGV